MFLFCSGLSRTNVLKSIDSRFQNLCNSLLPSKPAVLTPSSSKEGKGYNHTVSFDALNLWASKRGLAISQNRIETQNPRPLNLWGRGFVIYSTAVAGCRLSLPAGGGRGSFRDRLVPHRFLPDIPESRASFPHRKRIRPRFRCHRGSAV